MNTAAHSYRADVDGLRAVAILGVILFHANLGVPGWRRFEDDRAATGNHRPLVATGRGKRGQLMNTAKRRCL
jgi:peptidoglycan/LPS O-acetylase OafA/YrhL